MSNENTRFHETGFASFNGWAVLGLALAWLLVCGYVAFGTTFTPSGTSSAFARGPLRDLLPYGFSFGSVILSWAIALVPPIVAVSGLFTIDPNEVAVVSLTGRYKGVVSTDGLRCILPWYSTATVSKRLRNFGTSNVRVNDKSGNPIDLAAVVVWQVDDAAKASFLVDDYDDFIRNQSEIALRVLASTAYYDAEELTDQAKGDAADVGSSSDRAVAAGGKAAVIASTKVRTLIEDREGAGEEAAKILSGLIGDIGIRVESVNITHLAYAPEIASIMLRRQAASAIVSARRKIVEGATAMVNDVVAAFPQIAEDRSLKNMLTTNLMTVLVGDSPVTPVINVSGVQDHTASQRDR